MGSGIKQDLSLKNAETQKAKGKILLQKECDEAFEA
jgi:hypothetical protein